MLMYLLKSGACMAVFLMFYKLLLEKERMHFFKRYYLLGALVLSFGIPFITFVEYVTIEPISYTVSPEPVVAQPLGSNEILEEVSPIDTSSILWIVYTLGVLFFGWKFVRNLARLVRTIRTNPKHRMKNITNVLLRETLVPHTFFRYIFLNKKKFETGQIPNAVLLHEEAHARQKHSFDLLFIELLQVIFWFNPLLHLTKKSIKLNHEFLADQAVVTTGISSGIYQNLLLAFSSNAITPELANSLNYSSIKKRFTVMKTQTSKKSILIRTLLILPLFALVLYGFSTTMQIPKEEAPTKVLQEGATQRDLLQFNTLAKKYNATPKEKRVIPSGDLKSLEDIYGKMTESQKADAQAFPECPDPKSSDQEGATKKQVGEYNRLAKKYNTMLAENGNIRIKKSEVDRLEYLYGIMTQEQWAEAEPFPDFPEPPEPPMPPKKPGIEQQMNQLNKQSEEMEQQGVAMHEQAEKIEQQTMQLQKQSLRMEEEREVIEQKAREIEKEERAIQEMIENQEIIAEERPLKTTPAWHLNTEEEAEIYLRGKEITYAKMKKMEREGMITSMSIIKKPNGNSIIKLNQTNLQTPTPPKPKSPLDHIKDMVQQDALFYYEGKEISADKAIRILKKNDEINIDTRRNNDEKPIVRLSTEPIETEN